MFTSKIRLTPAPSHLRARTALLSSLLSSAALLLVTTPACSQSSTLDPVVVSPPKPQTATRQGGDQQGALRRAKRAARNLAAKPVPAPVNESAPTPLNSNVVAGSASRLGLTAHEMPASVELSARTPCASRAIGPRPRLRPAQSACSPAMRAVRSPASPCAASPAARSTFSTTASGSDRKVLPRASWIRPALSRSKSSRVRRRSCRALARSAAPSTM